MSNNLKTWPEIIYQPNINFANHPDQLDTVAIESDDIKYIRADIAMEREAKLLAAASDEAEVSSVRTLWERSDKIYKKAKLEELK